MKTLLGVLVILGLGGVVYLLIRKQLNGSVAGTGGVQPLTGPGTPSPSLCSQLVQLGAAGGSAAAGGPPVMVPNPGAQSICNMGEAVGKFIGGAARWTGTAAKDAGKFLSNGAVSGAKAVAKAATNPLNTITAAPKAILTNTVGRGVDAVFGGSGNTIDKNIANAINKKYPGFQSTNRIQCALRNKQGNWVETSRFCVDTRRATGFSNS